MLCIYIYNVSVKGIAVSKLETSDYILRITHLRDDCKSSAPKLTSQSLKNLPKNTEICNYCKNLSWYLVAHLEVSELILGLHPANKRRQSNAVYHWLGANLESALGIITLNIPQKLRQYHGCLWPGSLHCQVISSHCNDSGKPLI